jgi:formylglycine-generating enzyme required for sulfatase activity
MRTRSKQLLSGIFYISLCTAVCLPSGLLFEGSAKAQNEPEFADWQAAAREGSRDGYRAFLQLWPNSRFASEAARRLHRLDQSADNDLWKTTVEDGTNDAYDIYLKQFPNGLHAAEASSALRKIAASQPLSSDAEQRLKPQQEFRECIHCPSMVVVPSGEFLMGSPQSEIVNHTAYENEGPQHRVTISKQFALGKYEVTFAEWDACVSDGGCRGYRAGDGGWGRGSRPVINVSWDDAKLYARWLSQKTGKTYRLPSEAEWEYAARAGSSTRFFFGNDSKSLCKYANVADESGGQDKRGANGFTTWQLCNDTYADTAPVGSFKPNAFGLYDMLGNVDEWVEDVWHDNYNGGPADGSAWLSGGDAKIRIGRGGSFFNLEDGVRAAVRFNFRAGSQGTLVGFRIARTLGE